MKRFTIPCDFGTKKAPSHVYIGEITRHRHPLYYQEVWLHEERGGTIPADVVESFRKLRDIALDNNVSFEDLCVYALGSAQEEAQQKDSTGEKPNTVGPVPSRTEPAAPPASSWPSSLLPSMSFEDVLYHAYRGRVPAMHELAERYEKGTSIEQDNLMASLWRANASAGASTLSISCLIDAQGTKSNFEIVYLENYPEGVHPLHHEQERLLTEYRVRIPPEVMDSFEKLYTLAREQRGSFQALVSSTLKNENHKIPEKKAGGSVSGGRWILPGMTKGDNPPTIPEDLLDEEVIILMNGQNTDGEKIFAYLQLTLRSMLELKEAIDRDNSFMASKFGTVLAEGKGSPSNELRAEMATRGFLPNPST